MNRKSKALKYNRQATNRLIFFLILWSTKKMGYCEMIGEEESGPKLTSDCLLNILRNYFNDSKKIALNYDENDWEKFVVGQIFRFFHNPIMVNSEEVPKGLEMDLRTPSDVSLILSRVINIRRYLKNNLYTERTVFFAVLWEESASIENLFQNFWDFNIVNIFALKVERREIIVYYYVPYKRCDGNEALVLDVWEENRFKYGRIERVSRKYPVTSFNGCRLNVSAANVEPMIIFPNSGISDGSHEIDGIEGKLLKTLSEVLNSSFLYKVPRDNRKWGFVIPRPVGSIGEVYNKSSIIAAGGASTTLERITFVDAIIGTTGSSECVYWIVPSGAAKEQPVWLLIFVKGFSTATWVSYAGVVIVVVGVYKVFSTRSKKKRSLFDSFLLIFSSSLGITAKKPETTALKVLFAAWIWYSLVILNSFESSMKSKLTVPLRHKNLENFQDLLNSDLELYGVDSTIALAFKGNEDPVEKAIGERVKPWNSSIGEMVEKIVRERKSGYMREYVTFSYNAYQNKSYAEELHLIKQCVYGYYPTLFAQKRCPLTYVIRDVVLRLWEAGILLRWRSLFVQETVPSEPTIIKLTLGHMTAPFIAYAAGIGISIVAFVAEIAYRRSYNPWNRISSFHRSGRKSLFGLRK